MTKEVSIQGILDFFEDSVRQRHPIAPGVWVDSASKLNVLLGDEHAKLYDLQQTVAKMKMILVESGDSAVKASIKVEASDEYKEMLLQKAYIGRVEEHIRLSKLQARMAHDEARGYGI